VAIAQKLQTGLRATDTFARLGGDEFVILLDDLEDDAGAVRVADWINQELKNPFMLSGHKVFVTTSIGIVYSKLKYEQPEDVLRDADIAMYSAKASGRAHHEIFEPPMRKKITDRLTLETQLRQALERQEFRLHYQPIVSLENNHLTGFEALLRWQHPQRGLLNPVEFLDVAEDTGLITPIDRWVLLQACQQMVTWQEQYRFDPPLTISVNLSGNQFCKSDIIDYIAWVLSESCLPPEQLKIEITENALMDFTEATLQVFHSLRSMGVQIQIDDFGIGYSSLSYLSQFPINALKIDQYFVQRISTDSNRLKIVQAIVMLTQRLDVVVIAEGVENAQQLEQLKEMGCEYGQGYYLARPMDDQHTEGLLRKVAGTGGVMEYPP
jgi:EAL domain-containing protein (putative c-di-GMP-specific phosphodiesterase class I)